MKTISIHIALLLGAIIVAIGAFFALSSMTTAPVFGESYSSSCRTSTSTRISVGHQASTQVLATTSNRAFARISQIENGTNTVSVNFNNGEAATMSNGELIHIMSATGTVMSLSFGLNTDLPYTGAITARTNSGSTTVIVTQCNY